MGSVGRAGRRPGRGELETTLCLPPCHTTAAMPCLSLRAYTLLAYAPAWRSRL